MRTPWVRRAEKNCADACAGASGIRREWLPNSARIYFREGWGSGTRRRCWQRSTSSVNRHLFAASGAPGNPRKPREPSLGNGADNRSTTGIILPVPQLHPGDQGICHPLSQAPPGLVTVCFPGDTQREWVRAVSREALPDLLRAWRMDAGNKMNRGRQLPQKEVARRMGVSERWYRNLETGAHVPLSMEILERLSRALLLGSDERMALHGHALGGAGGRQPGEQDPRGATEELAALTSARIGFPSYLTDQAWNVLDHNAAMARWFPWVREPDANLMRWALTTNAAREQIVDWPRHAAQYLALLRFALVTRPDDTALGALRDAVLADRACRDLWDRGAKVLAYRHGHRYELRLPHVSPETIKVTSQVLLPAYRQELRYVLLLPTEDEPDGS
ncbi:helix-turn-helix domain-containing protein [Streptomyces sp. NPDC006251]|uniref:helix-turn-helix domain-containing protein n=1 Tax=Streptomyces sp. NPDC006251 TaxID=3155718 RepID=UPI0033BBA06B